VVDSRDGATELLRCGWSVGAEQRSEDPVVVRPGAGKGSSVTKRPWFLESLSIAPGEQIGRDTLLPKVPPDPYGTPTPPSVAAIGDGSVLVSVGTGGQQPTVAYGP